MSLEFSQETTGFSANKLIKMIDGAQKKVSDKLDELDSEKDEINIGQMFEMQMLMNELSQLSEALSSVVSASNTAIGSMARNIK